MDIRNCTMKFYFKKVSEISKKKKKKRKFPDNIIVIYRIYIIFMLRDELLIKY